MRRSLTLLAACVGSAAAQAEVSPYDGDIGAKISACGGSVGYNDTVVLTQTGRTKATFTVPVDGTWTSAWLEGSYSTKMAYTGSVMATPEFDWSASTAWAPVPNSVRAVVLYPACTWETSVNTLTWLGTVQAWNNARDSGNAASAPAEVRTALGTSPFRPTPTVSWGASWGALRTVSFTSDLGTDATSVDYVYVQSNGAIDELVDVRAQTGAYTSPAVQISEGALSVSACASVFYKTECASVDLRPHYVGTIESSATPVAGSSADIGVSSSQTLMYSTTVRVAASTACRGASSATVYARDAVGGSALLGYSTASELRLDVPFNSTSGVSSVAVYVVCDGAAAAKYLAIDVAALRVAIPATVTCDYGGNTYAKGSVLYQDAGGNDCICGPDGNPACTPPAGGAPLPRPPPEKFKVETWVLLLGIGSVIVVCLFLTACGWCMLKEHRKDQEAMRRSGIAVPEAPIEVITKRLSLTAGRGSVKNPSVVEMTGASAV